jgi:hypothetical protein
MCFRDQMPTPQSYLPALHAAILGGPQKYIPGYYISNLWRQRPNNNNKTAHLAVTDPFRYPLHHFHRSTLPTIDHPSPLLAMHFSRPLSLASLAALGSSQNTSLPEYPEPVAPGLTFLYTSLVECQNRLYTGPEGPRGIRTAIPILGGNVTGPRIKGESASFPLPCFARMAMITTATNVKQARSSTSALTGESPIPRQAFSAPTLATTSARTTGRTFCCRLRDQRSLRAVCSFALCSRLGIEITIGSTTLWLWEY